MENSCIQFINHYLTLLIQDKIIPGTSKVPLTIDSNDDRLSLAVTINDRQQAIRILLIEASNHRIHLLITNYLTAQASVTIYSENHQFRLTFTSTKTESNQSEPASVSGIKRMRIALLKKTRIIPVVGPDGAGKTAMLDELKQQARLPVRRYRFKNLIRHNLLYQISRLWLLKKVESEIPGDIKKAAVKDYYDDIIGDRVIGYGAVYYPFLATKQFLNRGFLFVDRFFHDFIIQNARFNESDSKLRNNWKYLLKRTPDTFWFLHLDAPNHIILSRKQELSEQAINAYRECMFEMYLQKPSPAYSYINTELPITNCVETIKKMGEEIGYNL